MKLHAVLHARSVEGTIENAKIAMNEGMDGVFLINQGMVASQVLEAVPRVREAFVVWGCESGTIGVNLLGYTPFQVLRVTGQETRVDAIWTDHVSGDARLFAEERVARRWAGQWFGGVCFKYGPDEDASPEEIRKICRRPELAGVDVITTSGPGTGHAAPIAKVRAFRGALNARPLALASGVTADNVGVYMSEGVNHVLVGTGIESRFGFLDPARVAALVHAVRAHALKPL